MIDFKFGTQDEGFEEQDFGEKIQKSRGLNHSKNEQRQV